QRLAACVKADTAFVTFVVENCDPSVISTIDQHRRRSYRDVLRARGEVHEAALEGALIWLMRYKDGTMAKRAVNIPWTRLDRLLAKADGLREVVAHTVAHPATLLNEAIRTPLAYMGGHKHKAAVDTLLAQLAKPDDFEPGDPGVVLAGILERERDREDRITRPVKFALAVMAYNDIVRHRKSRTYDWTDRPRRGKPAMEFPEVLGFKPEDVEEMRAPPVRAGTDALSELARSGHTLRWRVETITPSRAHEYLKANTGNRKIVATHVDALVRDIQAGVYQLNFDAIAFAENGRLLDGQHRLSACEKSGCNIESLVLEGLSEDTYDTFDVHAKHGVDIRDLMNGRAVDMAQVKAAAVLHWKATHPDLPFGSKPTSHEVRAIIEANPKLVELRTFGDANRNLGPPAVLNYLAFKYTEEAPRLAAIFLHQLQHPEEIERGSPVLPLRGRLIRLRENKERPTDRYTIMGVIEKGWKRFRAYRKNLK
ncbi:MAG TPA: hypothetical protein VMB81_32040, partial [Candidatus Sulfotelmatobacter sp.]|nr:hypothetical protein [Candidatus Sulfotelmatobacter sp.]